MHLLISLASILGIEAEDFVARLRRQAVAWGIVGFFCLVGFVFLLIAANSALSDWIGPVLAPLLLAGAALAIALTAYAVIRISDRISSTRRAVRRHAAERTALMTTATMTAVPVILKSPLLRGAALPAAAAALALYLLTKPNPPPGGTDSPN